MGQPGFEPVLDMEHWLLFIYLFMCSFNLKELLTGETERQGTQLQAET